MTTDGKRGEPPNVYLASESGCTTLSQPRILECVRQKPLTPKSKMAEMRRIRPITQQLCPRLALSQAGMAIVIPRSKSLASHHELITAVALSSFPHSGADRLPWYMRLVAFIGRVQSIPRSHPCGPSHSNTQRSICRRALRTLTGQRFFRMVEMGYQERTDSQLPIVFFCSIGVACATVDRKSVV